jgi:hypothetical protein
LAHSNYRDSSVDKKIDFVIAWVDGNDPDWQVERKLNANDSKGDNRNIRFRDWNNLHYWFRSVEKYTPWVNKIYFITWGHLPTWLNTKHPKLQIVKHEDYIPEEYLPTFSSRTIELNLHRIENLSSQLVYFNDDMFIIKTMKKEDFFRNSLPCDCAVLMPNISMFRNSTAGIVANTMEIINTSFNKNKVIRKNLWKWFNPIYKKHLVSTLCSMPYKNFTGFFIPHLPNSYFKKTFFDLWSLEAEILHRTCLAKFRDGQGVSQLLVRYWQLVTGEFTPRRISIGSCYSLTNNNEKIISAIKEQKYKMICINDNDIDPIIDFEREKELIKRAFDQILPDKCSYEI